MSVRVGHRGLHGASANVRDGTAVLMIARGQRPEKPQGAENRGPTPEVQRPNVALTKDDSARNIGNNHHMDVFLRANQNLDHPP